jgi:Domain of unknown function (DUF4349)
MSRLLLIGFMLAAAVGCQDKEGGPFPAAAGPAGDAAPKMGKEPGGPEAAEPERKIIYTARVELRVADLDAAREKLDALLAGVKGYVAKSDETGKAGTFRMGTWKVRVPVAKFHGFLNDVQALGELVNKSADAQDVTEEFVDTEARLKNLKAEEAVLNRLLQEKAQSTADLLAFRQQITQVREQIERYQARLDTLSRLTAMTTIDLVMREDKTFVPETAPTFGASVQRTFADSVEGLENLGRGLVLALVAVAPWLPVILIGLWLARRGYRAAFRPQPRREPPAVPRPRPADGA